MEKCLSCLPVRCPGIKRKGEKGRETERKRSGLVQRSMESDSLTYGEVFCSHPVSCILA